jgi:hypothetical protein
VAEGGGANEEQKGSKGGYNKDEINKMKDKPAYNEYGGASNALRKQR